MLAGLASQAATTGGFLRGLMAFVIAAASLVATLMIAALILTTVSDRRLGEIRTSGPQVKPLAGALLIVVGAWFAYLAIANPTGALLPSG